MDLKQTRSLRFVKVNVKGFLNKNFFFCYTLADIDECNTNKTSFYYNNLNDIYTWKKCNEMTSQCVNTIGGYKCECKSKFAKISDDCVDVNECELLSWKRLNCSINSECVNYNGGYECTCHKGYKMVAEECLGKLHFNCIVIRKMANTFQT